MDWSAGPAPGCLVALLTLQAVSVRTCCRCFRLHISAVPAELTPAPLMAPARMFTCGRCNRRSGASAVVEATTTSPLLTLLPLQYLCKCLPCSGQVLSICTAGRKHWQGWMALNAGGVCMHACMWSTWTSSVEWRALDPSPPVFLHGSRRSSCSRGSCTLLRRLPNHVLSSAWRKHFQIFQWLNKYRLHIALSQRLHARAD